VEVPSLLKAFDITVNGYMYNFFIVLMWKQDHRTPGRYLLATATISYKVTYSVIETNHLNLVLLISIQRELTRHFDTMEEGTHRCSQGPSSWPTMEAIITPDNLEIKFICCSSTTARRQYTTLYKLNKFIRIIAYYKIFLNNCRATSLQKHFLVKQVYILGYNSRRIKGIHRQTSSRLRVALLIDKQ
jgi:hypothetical protein